MTKNEKENAIIFLHKWCCEHDEHNFVPKNIAIEMLNKLESGFWKNVEPPIKFGEPMVYNAPPKFGEKK